MQYVYILNKCSEPLMPCSLCKYSKEIDTMAKKYICRKCGGQEFYVIAHIAQ